MIPTGTVSLQDVQNEFGGVNPIGIDEYYANGGGGYVINGQYTGGTIPTSGTISLANFQGVAKITSFTFSDTITTNTSVGYDLAARATAAGWNGTSKLIALVAVNSGVTVAGPSGGFIINKAGGFPAGSTLSLTNNGTIAGMGGTGGAGGTVNGSFSGPANGGAGATGLVVGTSTGLTINLFNSGTIAGGGGGGGGGGSAYWTDAKGALNGAPGAGGGGGRAVGAAGANGTSNLTVVFAPATSPTAGSYTAAGTGGTGGGVGPIGPDGGNGGAGGDYGQPGSPGTLAAGEYTARSGVGAGGAAGAAITGGAAIFWYSYGTRIGTVDNPGTNMVAGGIDTSWSGGTVDAYRISAGSATARITLNADGTITYGTTGAGVTLTTPGSGANWYSPTTGGIGGSYWVRVTTTGSALSAGTTGTWLSLSAGQSWASTSTGTALAITSKATALTFSFSTSASGTPVVGTATFNLSSMKDG